MRKYRRFKELSKEQILTSSEQMALLSQPDKSSLIGRRDYAILKLFLSTGLRKAELLNLKIKDFKCEDKQHYLIVHSKGGTIDEQDIMNPQVIEAIRKYLKMSGHEQSPEDPLFKPSPKSSQSKDGHLHRRSIDSMLKKYAREAEIQKNVTAHMLRHTFGSMIYSACKNIATTQRLMRHRSLSSTMIYLHSDRQDGKKALTKI